MSEVVEILTAPWGHPFMQRAFVVAAMSSIVCGAIGCYVVLRGMAFIGDTIAHAVFPGIAVAFVLEASLVLGGIAAGLATALAIAAFSQNRRLREDTVIGVFFAAAFALGIVILSTAPGYGGSLESFLFGQVLAISPEDVLTVAVVGAGLVALLASIGKELMAVSLDRETARAAGLPVFWLDILLYAMVTVAIVISLQAVGNILVLALLVTPAACARLLTDRLAVMMALAPVIGICGSLAGLYASYWLGIAAGGAIVLAITTFFIGCWLLAPRHGLLRRVPGRHAAGRVDARPSAAQIE